MSSSFISINTDIDQAICGPMVTRSEAAMQQRIEAAIESGFVSVRGARRVAFEPDMYVTRKLARDMAAAPRRKYRAFDTIE